MNHSNLCFAGEQYGFDLSGFLLCSFRFIIPNGKEDRKIIIKADNKIRVGLLAALCLFMAFHTQLVNAPISIVHRLLKKPFVYLEIGKKRADPETINN